MEIGLLSLTDLPAALQLSTQAGWNQLSTDWQRLLDLWPDGCLVGRVNGNVVATATVATYGSLAWIGMVLVDEKARGGGLGGRIFSAAMRHALSAGATTIGLDATDMGRPVYLKQGFVDIVPITRWLWPGTEGATVDIAPTDDRAAIVQVDREATHLNRQALIDHLLREESVRTCVLAGGYGIRRPGRLADQIGPLIAQTPEQATTLMIALLDADRSRPAMIDVMPISGWADSLQHHGWSVVRRLSRMIYPKAVDPGPLCGGQIFAAAGFELG